MGRNTAKVLFITALLLQWGNSVKAAEYQIKDVPIENYADSKNASLFVSHKIFRDFNKGSVQSISLAKSQPNPQAPPNLYMPNKSSDLKKSKQYSLNLEDIELIVESNNPELERFRRRIEQEKYNLKQAISAWYPTIDLTASPQYLKGDEYKDSKPDTSSDQWKTTMSIDINWNLIDPARAPEISAAKKLFEKAKTSYLIKLRDLKLEAFNRFFLLQKANEGVRIGEESVKASQISLYDAKARLEAGLGTKLEVLEAETQLARDQKLLTQKKGDQSINRSGLSQILNLPYNIVPIAENAPKIIGLWDSSLEESIISAYTFREELEKIRLDISINNSKANARLAESDPTVSLYNTFSNSYTDGKSASIETDGSTMSNTLGVKATWRIFDGWRARSGYNLNKEIAKASEAEFAERRNTIRQEIETNYFNLMTAKEEINSSSSEVSAAKESLRLARLRFKAGVNSQREVVNNQRDLTEAEVAFSNAIADYNKNIIELQRRTGIDYIDACYSSQTKDQNQTNSPDLISMKSFASIQPCIK